MPELCALDLAVSATERWIDRPLSALNIMDRRLLSNLVEHTRVTSLLAELPSLSGMSEGGLQQLANGDAAWVHGNARR